jgi:hypothetical protein
MAFKEEKPNKDFNRTHWISQLALVLCFWHMAANCWQTTVAASNLHSLQ